MLPLKDNIPTSRFPIVTVGLIVACVIVFIWQLNFPTNQRLDQAGFGSIDQSSLDYGAIPYRITHTNTGDCSVGAVAEVAPNEFEAGVVCPGTKDYAEAVARSREHPTSDLGPFRIDQKPWWVTLFTSMFMHGGILHIAGNMLFLWVFGNNIEDRLGRVKFLLFYLLAGLIAVYTQALIDPGSTAPTIGASGAIAGVLGAYAWLFPRARVLTLIFIIFFVTRRRDTGVDPAGALVHPSVRSGPGPGRGRAQGAAKGSPTSRTWAGSSSVRPWRGPCSTRHEDAESSHAYPATEPNWIQTSGPPCCCSA